MFSIAILTAGQLSAVERVTLHIIFPDMDRKPIFFTINHNHYTLIQIITLKKKQLTRPKDCLNSTNRRKTEIDFDDQSSIFKRFHTAVDP